MPEVSGAGLGDRPNVAALPGAAQSGGKPDADALFCALYAQLRRLARHQLARQGAPVSLSPTTLLHQAYIEIAGLEGTSFPDRNRFMAYAARVMRALIIDHARARCAQKRGGGFEITALDADIRNPVDHRELERVSAALDELARIEPALAQVVDLKFFCGFSFLEIAALKDVNERTVQRLWQKARIYLHGAMRDEGA